jgi:hypothetical protein
MIEVKINFTQIRQRVEAAALLQDAGEDAEAKSSLPSYRLTRSAWQPSWRPAR